MPHTGVESIVITRVIGTLLAAAALGACAPARPAPPVIGAAPSIPDAIRVRHQGRIERVALDTYAAAVALTELAPGAQPVAVADAVYDAQIIVARTYAASRRGRHGAEGFDLCDATHCQRYEPARLETARWARAAKAAAARTAGQVLVHQGRLIDAVFHADCGGHTADARDVWGSARPYLRIRGRTTVEVDGDVFRAAVSSALGLQALPSTRFTLRETRGGWEAAGTGFGHGVGLCQTGALARARAGASAARILGFYYPGAIIRRAGAA